ncbi:MAG: ABC transporter substrate-binding protein [bacterium]
MKFIKNLKKFNNKIIKATCIITSFMFLTTTLTSCSLLSSNNTPIKNTTLKIAGSEQLINTGKMVSPWREISIFTRLSFRNIFTVDSITNEIKPDLAKSYSVSSDGLVYTMVIRDDLIWSDGEPINIDDIIFSIKASVLDNDYTMIFPIAFDNINGVSDFLNGDSDEIAGLSVDYENNIFIITLDNPIANFPQVLSQFTILPKHILKDEDLSNLATNDFWSDPIVSGMYKLGEYIPNEQLTYVYNDKYIDAVPNIESITVRSDYEFKEVDYYTTNDISEIMDFRTMFAMKEIDIEALYYRYLIFNIDKNGEPDPVLSDIRIRQAIAYSIDNETLVGDIYYKTGTPIDSGLVSGSDRAYTYDPQKSKDLLAEANYDFNRPLVLLHYYEDETSIKFMEKMEEYLQAVGFKTEIIHSGDIYSEEYDTYDIGLKSLSAFDLTEWYAEYHSSHDLYKNVFGGEPLFDELINNLNATITPEDKINALTDLQILAYNSLYKYPIFTMNYKAYVNTTRLTIPDEVVIGNPTYKYDNEFENWVIKNE